MIIEHQDAFEAEIADAMRACIARREAEDAAHQERGTELGRQEREIKERLAQALLAGAHEASLGVLARAALTKARGD